MPAPRRNGRTQHPRHPTLQPGDARTIKRAFTLKPGQRKARHLSALLTPDRELRFRVVGPEPDAANPERAVWVDFLPAEDGPMEYRVTLGPTAKRQTQKVKAADLGEAGPWLGIENKTDQEVKVVVTVAD